MDQYETITSSRGLLWRGGGSHMQDVGCVEADIMAHANGLHCAERLVKLVTERGGKVEIHRGTHLIREVQLKPKETT